ncbi:MAG: LysR family transcriptional regulator [Burkholderiales bacterium]
MFDIRYLLDFMDLARTGNFSATALNRSISQPALTRRIQQLEQWAGRKLFDRSKTPLTLTPAGEDFRPIAARIVEELDAFQARNRHTANAAIRCMTIHSLGPWVSPTQTAQNAPAISFGTYDQCFAALRNGDIDVALVCQTETVRDARFRGFARKRIGTEAFIPVVSAEYFVNMRAGRAFVVQLSCDNYLGKALSAACGRATRLPGYAAGPLATRIDALRGLVGAGAGMGWLPENMVAAELASGRLCRIDDATLEVKLDVVLLATLKEKLDAAIQFIVPISRSHRSIAQRTA